jgi:flagellar hook-length control protein FliK
LAPLRLRHDGTAKLALSLRPEELGRVDVELRFERGTMHLILRAEQPATANLLRDTIEDLRGQLQDHGISTGDMSVGDQAHHREARREQKPAVQTGPDDEHVTASIDPLATDADALVDVRM